MSKFRAAVVAVATATAGIGFCGSARFSSSPAIVWAQALSQPAASATPLPHVPIAIPVNPPKGWDAKTWNRLRQQCQEIADKSSAGVAMTRAEYQAAQSCMTMVPYPPSATREPAILCRPRPSNRSLASAIPVVRSLSDRMERQLRLIPRTRVSRVRANLPTSRLMYHQHRSWS